MKFNPDIHHRKTIRLREYDYSQTGFYFVTICTQNRAPLFGDIIDGLMVLNEAGRMVQTVWNDMSAYYPDVLLDEFVIMPNHVHGIVIVGAAPCGRPDDKKEMRESKQGHPQGVAPTKTMMRTLSLPDIVHRFKSMTTKRYIQGVNEHNWPCFPGRLWQRNYWERIIRNDQELNMIREYIRNNPGQWILDDLYLSE